jgi:hypothetical protein
MQTAESWGVNSSQLVHLLMIRHRSYVPGMTLIGKMISCFLAFVKVLPRLVNRELYGKIVLRLNYRICLFDPIT